MPCCGRAEKLLLLLLTPTFSVSVLRCNLVGCLCMHRGQALRFLPLGKGPQPNWIAAGQSNTETGERRGRQQRQAHHWQAVLIRKHSPWKELITRRCNLTTCCRPISPIPLPFDDCRQPIKQRCTTDRREQLFARIFRSTLDPRPLDPGLRDRRGPDY